jgi:hypothetical protein
MERETRKTACRCKLCSNKNISVIIIIMVINTKLSWSPLAIEKFIATYVVKKFPALLVKPKATYGYLVPKCLFLNAILSHLNPVDNLIF